MKTLAKIGTTVKKPPRVVEKENAKKNAETERAKERAFLQAEKDGAKAFRKKGEKA